MVGGAHRARQPPCCARPRLAAPSRPAPPTPPESPHISTALTPNVSPNNYCHVRD